MIGWTLVVCPEPGRSARPFRLSAPKVFAFCLATFTVLSVATAVGWAVGEHQAQAVLGDSAR